MKVSLEWLSELVDLSSLGIHEVWADKISELLTARGIEVEEISRQDAGLEKVVAAKLLERKPHPQADRLSVCTVSVGGGEPLQIVCGAQNMKAGDTVALAQIGALLPNGLKISQSKIRGVESFGMLCSEEELKFLAPGAQSEGILILPPATPIGVGLAQILGRSDVILTLKLTANRADCLSHVGLAREIGAALGVKAKIPAGKSILNWDVGAQPVTLALDAGENGPQFWGVAIDGVQMREAPAHVRKRLESLGQRSINAVVDATNWVLLEQGHPTHAYDADKIGGKRLAIRQAKSGERLPLLDGTEITLEGIELVIADGASGERAVGLAGVMGGGNSEVGRGTARVFLECAEFKPGHVRRASSLHQKKTEASHRFERGVDPAALERVIARLSDLVTEWTGGRVVAATRKLTPARTNATPVSISYPKSDPAQFLGLELSAHDAKQIFGALECKVVDQGDVLEVTPPSYRLDLKLREDLSEELARSLGYDRIPETIPKLSSDPRFAGSSGDAIFWIDRAKDILVRLGFNEALSMAFTSRAWLARFGMQSAGPLLNPISEEFEALVPSLLPGLVRSALDNWHHHFGSEVPSIRLFELRPTFHKGSGETGYDEQWKLAFVASGARIAEGLKNDRAEVDFADLRAVLESLAKGLGAKGVRFIPVSQSRTQIEPGSIARLVHPHQAVEVWAGGKIAGYAGLVHPRLARELKLRAPLWICELDWATLVAVSRSARAQPQFRAWSTQPPMERDFALLVREDVAVEKLTQVALKAGKPLAKSAQVFDVYRGAQVPEGMTSVALRVIFYEDGRSLQETETEAASNQILAAWKKELGIELRG